MNAVYDIEDIYSSNFEPIDVDTIFEDSTDDSLVGEIIDLFYGLITSIPIVGDVTDAVIKWGFNIINYVNVFWHIFTYDPNLAFFTYFVLVPCTFIAVYIVVVDIAIPIIEALRG